MDIQKQIAFEKFHAKECNCDYNELKRRLDHQEKVMGHRYIPSSPRHEAWLVWDAAWQAKVQAVPEGFVLLEKKGLRDTYYWDGCEYVVDCPSEYEMELERDEIVTLEKWQRTKETNVYCANIFSDEDNFELVQFDSLEEAKKAVAANKAMIETQEQKG